MPSRFQGQRRSSQAEPGHTASAEYERPPLHVVPSFRPHKKLCSQVGVISCAAGTRVTDLAQLRLSFGLSQRN